MPESEIKKCFNELLDYAEIHKDVSPEKVAEALLELSDRQWHTYTLIDIEAKDRIEKWIADVWNIASFALVESITELIGYLGLVNTYELVKESLKFNLDDNVRIEIEDIIHELD